MRARLLGDLGPASPPPERERESRGMAERRAGRGAIRGSEALAVRSRGGAFAEDGSCRDPAGSSLSTIEPVWPASWKPHPGRDVEVVVLRPGSRTARLHEPPAWLN